MGVTMTGIVWDSMAHPVGVYADPPQAADPFDGLGDFEIAPESFEMMQLRESERRWREKAICAEMSIRQVESVLCRPLKKLPKADLLRLIGIAADAAGALDRRLFQEGITE